MIKKILIVDDSPVARMMLKSCIPKNKSYDIYEAENGKDGVEKYKHLVPDVVFMDLTMPVLDGYEATSQIINMNNEAIIIVSTADIQPNSISTIKKFGAFMVIEKPPKSSSIQVALAKADIKLEKVSGAA
ncbi:MAG: response regulator [Desulfobacterales bacterium]|nr:response regulator [Desulfobacterales bacterium]